MMIQARVTYDIIVKSKVKNQNSGNICLFLDHKIMKRLND
jgi:hypothetical protein